MTLGADWDTWDLMTTPVLLSSSTTETGYYWIDQFCVDQANDAELSDILASVPNIYRTFDVTVLIAGGLCQCWSDIGHKSCGPESAAFAAGDGPSQVFKNVCDKEQAFDHWFSRL